MALLQQTQPGPTWQVVRVDRVADRFDAEKTQSWRTIEQVVIAAGGLAFQLVTKVGLLNQAVAIPVAETVVDQCLGQGLGLLEIPFGR
ncbi:hypothetical protein D9M71_785700 [compost metagenome]